MDGIHPSRAAHMARIPIRNLVPLLLVLLLEFSSGARGLAVLHSIIARTIEVGDCDDLLAAVAEERDEDTVLVTRTFTCDADDWGEPITVRRNLTFIGYDPTNGADPGAEDAVINFRGANRAMLIAGEGAQLSFQDLMIGQDELEWSGLELSFLGSEAHSRGLFSGVVFWVRSCAAPISHYGEWLDHFSWPGNSTEKVTNGSGYENGGETEDADDNGNEDDNGDDNQQGVVEGNEQPPPPPTLQSWSRLGRDTLKMEDVAIKFKETGVVWRICSSVVHCGVSLPTRPELQDALNSHATHTDCPNVATLEPGTPIDSDDDDDIDIVGR